MPWQAYSGKKLLTVIGRKVIGIGRNYIEHAKELNNPIPKIPVVFLKPTSSVITKGSIEIPEGCEVHHEVELGVVIGQEGRNIPRSKAMDFITGYVCCLDMTARDLQGQAKEKGLPWTVAKGFDTFCPVSTFLPKAAIGDPHNLDLWCKIDGEIKQEGNTRDMIFDIPDLISYLSGIMTLEPGDLICTGTPEGVGPLFPGQTIEAGIKGHVSMSFPAVARQGSTWSKSWTRHQES
eukprot:Rmarinus@m.26818